MQNAAIRCRMQNSVFGRPKGIPPYRNPALPKCRIGIPERDFLSWHPPRGILGRAKIVTPGGGQGSCFYSLPPHSIRSLLPPNIWDVWNLWGGVGASRRLLQKGKSTEHLGFKRSVEATWRSTMTKWSAQNGLKRYVDQWKVISHAQIGNPISFLS